MKKQLTNFSRVLYALLLCAGLVFAGCTDGPLGDNQNTEQGDNQNNGNENGGDNAGGSQDKPADENEVTSGPATITIDKITATTVTFKGKIDVLDADKDFCQVTIRYSEPEGFNAVDESLSKVVCSSFDDNNEFTIVLANLKYNTTYKYCVIAKVRTEETYSEKAMTFKTGNVTLNFTSVSTTAATAELNGIVDGLFDADKQQISLGILYGLEKNKVENKEGTRVSANLKEDSTLSLSLSSLSNGTEYYYRTYVKQGRTYTYGELRSFSSNKVSVSVSVKQSNVVGIKPTVTFTGTVMGLAEEDKSFIEIGVAYHTNSENLKTDYSTKVVATTVSPGGIFEAQSNILSVDSKYYYCSYIKQNNQYIYNDTMEFCTWHPYSVQSDLNASSATDLSSSGSANCYIVSKTGLYKFKAVKGNSTKSVSNVSSVSILWETFGTSTSPEVLDLIKAVCYKDTYILFQTADSFREGNAVVAAKDASGNILWSWHIWFTDQPKGQVYYSNAGTVVDRKLGATSATPGSDGVAGLLYQWGRKDPFLGTTHCEADADIAKSTITWPYPVQTGPSTGTIAYAIAHPTTFISGEISNSSTTNGDWYYTGSTSTDNTRWTKSDNTKSSYDPCPAGWRVPDGGSNGVWSKAKGSSSSFAHTFSTTDGGMNFSGIFGSSALIWYPASGSLSVVYDHVGTYGDYWSASTSGNQAYFLTFFNEGYVAPSRVNFRSYACAVRCIQE